MKYWYNRENRDRYNWIWIGKIFMGELLFFYSNCSNDWHIKILKLSAASWSTLSSHAFNLSMACTLTRPTRRAWADDVSQNVQEFQNYWISSLNYNLESPRKIHSKKKSTNMPNIGIVSMLSQEICIENKQHLAWWWRQ